MKSETIFCVVALLLGMLLANMFQNVCGCKNIEGSSGVFDESPGLVPGSAPSQPPGSAPSQPPVPSCPKCPDCPVEPVPDCPVCPDCPKCPPPVNLL